MKLMVSGRSMYPLIKEGCALSIDVYALPQPLAQQKEGQVVLAREGQVWTVHRVIQSKGIMALKGDWSDVAFYASEPVVWGQVNGVSNSSWLSKISAWDLRLPRFLILLKRALLLSLPWIYR